MIHAGGAVRDFRLRKLPPRGENDVRSAITLLEVSATGCASSGKPTTKSPNLAKPARQPAHDDLIHRSPAPSPTQGRPWPICEHLSKSRRNDLHSSSAIYRPSGWWPMCAKRKHQYVHVGQALRFSVWVPDLVFTANIAYVATSFDLHTTAAGACDLDNKQGLLVRNVRQRYDSHRRGRQFAGGAARGHRFRRQVRPCLGRADDRSVEPRDIKTGLSNGR